MAMLISVRYPDCDRIPKINAKKQKTKKLPAEVFSKAERLHETSLFLNESFKHSSIRIISANKNGLRVKLIPKTERLKYVTGMIS